ncbi:MAG: DUF6552 family protein [Candidatus Nanopelagicus sp.]
MSFFDYLKQKDWYFWFEVLATLTLILGVALTSYNVYPLNIWFSLIGNLGWFFLGIFWRKWSLIFVQLIIIAIYCGGIYNTL